MIDFLDFAKRNFFPVYATRDRTLLQQPNLWYFSDAPLRCVTIDAGLCEAKNDQEIIDAVEARITAKFGPSEQAMVL